MLFKVSRYDPRDPITVTMRCPNCRQVGSFEWNVQRKDIYISNDPHVVVGNRRCPNRDCNAHIFVVLEASGTNKVLVSYPAERIDFDATDIPSNVVASLEEAITCHSNQCYIAAAIMVRKTLEELCSAEGATGNNLFQRVDNLRTQIVIPNELMQGLDDLRLLGNEAAHIDSRIYDEIGQKEVEVALEFTKEILKAMYQYKSLLQSLRDLKISTQI